MAPGAGSRSERDPIASYSKQTNRVSWLSDTDLETDPDEDVLINGGPVHRYNATVYAANRKKRPYSVRYKEYCATRKAKKRAVLIVFVVIFLIIIIGLVYLYYSKTSLTEDEDPLQKRPVVQVQCGKVIGTSETRNKHALYEFKGIRYAQSPTGSNRWKAPVALSAGNGCWKSPYDAIKFRSQCAQLDPATNIPVGSEDCLFLNIFTPSLDTTSNLPVLVWFHGGNFVFFNSSITGYYPGPDFAADDNVVAVSINYRLNVFGFLALDALSANSASNTSGNYGLMDQIEALRWIKSNIKQFGGDPFAVTIAGHGSGGTSVLALTTSPLTDGLFNRAISMSGSVLLSKTSAQASRNNQQIIERTLCNGTALHIVTCLYNLTTVELLKATPPSWWNAKSYFDLPVKDESFPALATIDGVVLPFAPENVGQHQRTCKDVISLLIGTTAQETSFQPSMCFLNKSYDSYSNYVHLRLDSFSKSTANKALAMYQNTSKDNLQLAFETMSSDVRATCPNNYLASKLSSNKCYDVFRYTVTNVPSHDILPGTCRFLHAYHKWDTSALFSFKLVKNFKPWARDDKFQHDLKSQIVHFIKFGHPLKNHWNTYPLATGDFAADALKVVKNDQLMNKHCDFWETSGFHNYGWVN